MHGHTLEPWRHAHRFAGEHTHGERSTARVMALTAAMMAVEVAAGIAFGSLALLADGWHMATHVAAFGIALFAYRYARSHADNPRYTFGTGKVSVLGGFASAVALAVVALVMTLESAVRLVEPHAIRFDEAIAVAVAGLAVNLVSGWILKRRGVEGEAHAAHDAPIDAHRHHDHHHDHDHNLRAAYLHVLADALTSVLAIVALLAGKYLNWMWLDPAMGFVGAALITRWAYGMLRETGHILLDGGVDEDTQSAIQRAIEADADNLVSDLHVWYVGPHQVSASISIVTHQPRPPDHYKGLLARIPHLAHVLIEVNPCPGEICGQTPVA